MMAVGRGGFGIEYALASRYSTITLLAPLGMYLATLNLHNIFLYGFILSIILVEIVVGYLGGIYVGSKIAASRLEK